jgi:cytochrome c553
MRTAVAVATLFWTLPTLGLAADQAAGKATAEAVCAACHGANGVSVGVAIPNLAGQKAAYLQAQLRALKAGTRKNAVMGAIASQLSADDISNVAAFFSSLPGAGGASAKSDFLPSLSKTSATLPEGYPSRFTMYQTVNRPDINQVRYLYANAVALQAAREGKALPDGSVLVLEQHAAKLGDDKKPVVGADGFFVKDRFLAYAVMGRDAGWGKDIPELLRNEDWNYAVYTPEKQRRAGVNQAECLACHKPLDKTSFTFSIEPLTSAAKATR